MNIQEIKGRIITDVWHPPLLEREHAAPGFMALPHEIGDILTKTPQAEKLLYVFSDFAEVDQITANHSVIVAEAAMRLWDRYIENLKPEDQRIVRNFLKENAVALGYLLHDIGKALIHPDPYIADSIVNDQPPNGHDPKKDHRSPLLITLMHLHPLSGGEALEKLHELPYFSDIPKEFCHAISQFAYSHHELPGFNTHNHKADGNKVTSYPRVSLRDDGGLWGLAHMFIRLADRSIAMGFPRSFRPTPLLDTSIYHGLQQIVNPHDLRSIFGEMSDKKCLLDGQKFIEDTFDVLDEMQSNYLFTWGDDLTRTLNGHTLPTADAHIPYLRMLSEKLAWNETYKIPQRVKDHFRGELIKRGANPNDLKNKYPHLGNTKTFV